MEGEPSKSDASLASTADSNGSDGEPDDFIGELALLTATLVEETTEKAERLSFVSEFEDAISDTFNLEKDESLKASPALSSLSNTAHYGEPLSEEDASRLMPPGQDGLVWHATIVPDNFAPDGKLIRGLNARDFDLKDPNAPFIKPRRPSLPVTVSQLFSSLTRIDDGFGPRYVFHGVLNGWPSLRTFELIAIDRKRSIGPLTAPDYLRNDKLTWQHYWSQDQEGRDGQEPKIVDQTKIYRAKLRGAPWSSIGWSMDSPGFLFWFEALREEGPRVTYGTNTIKAVGDAKCKMVHMISHRYAIQKESAKDKVTYHSIVLLEWEHGEYCTIVEGAYLNGLGGYKGRSNWYHSRDDGATALYKAFPPEMVSPWLTSAAEIRCFDVPLKGLDDLKDFISKYQGSQGRFVDPHYTFSHPARLTYRSRSNIAQYLLNYIGRDCSYSELKRNCQTLAADLCSFLAGKKGVEPYHPINRIEYKNRTHLFLYDSGMFQRARGSLKGKIVR